MLFLAVGAITAGIYFFIFTVFWKMLHVDYRVSVSIAYVLSVTFQFLTNRGVTFKNHSHNVLNQLIRYVVMLVINYGITMAVVEYTVKVLLLSPYFGVIFSVGITVITGFLLSKLWVFKTA